jgi:hypothetical protein
MRVFLRNALWLLLFCVALKLVIATAFNLSGG